MKTVNLSDFTENPDNPSKISDDDFDRLVGKIRRFPEALAAHRIAFVTDKGTPFVVISGNKRLRALKRIYGETAKVNADWFEDVTGLTEAQRHEFIVAANVSDGEWDLDRLLAQYERSELADLLPDDQLEAILDGIEETETAGKTDADAVPETPAEPKSRRGAIYQLGRHRVMCGDSTNADDVARLMGGERADMVYTDPPYNVAIGDKNKALDEVGGEKVVE